MSNNNTNTQKTTFWKFLTDKTIEIPIIQRDYAQGREGKEHLRKKFLSDLKVALDKGEELKLDFVYGSKENNKLNPLDGQQRLTTLWLLHWYIALRSGRLTDANTTLNKFTYETRISSREFCKELCKTDNFDNYCFGDIVEYIKNQTWFYSAWKQDPTIQSMLRMLGGTKNEKGGPNNDGIEQVFNRSLRRQKLGCRCLHKLRKYQFKVYYHKLTNSNECPIIFYYLPLNEFKLTDDLYIKMNARGEQLTSFENFKADLIGYITKQKDNNELPEKTKEKWGELLDKKNGIPIKMDTDWTNIFWKNKSQDYKIDEIYFAFLNRFFLNWRISIINDDKDAGYKYLTGDEKGENEIVYKTINDYYLNDKIEIVFFDQLKTILNNYHDSKIDESSDILRHDKTWNEKFYFIPKYNEEKATEIGYKGNLVNKIYTVNQKERVAFYAICKYFNAKAVEQIDGKLDYTSLKRWMRVVWNMISVQTADGRDAIRNVAEMKNAIELIDKIHDPHRVYECLSGFKRSDFSGSLLKDQFAEEIAKAKQIIDEDGNPRNYNGSCQKADGSNYQTWEEIIVDAESYAFFKGAIRFLFQNAEGNVTEESWELFDTKFGKAKEYFDEKNLKQTQTIELAKYCTDKQLKSIWSGLSFEYKNWKSILLKDSISKPIHDFLLGNDHTTSTQLYTDIKNILSKISSSDVWLLQNWPTYWHTCKIVLTNYSQRRAEPFYGWVFDVGNEVRNKWSTMVSRIPELTIRTPQAKGDEKIETNGQVYYRGLWVDVEYNDHFFRFYGDNTICLMDDVSNSQKLKDPTQPYSKDNCYYTIIDGTEDRDAFLIKLKDLIDTAKTDTLNGQ